MNHQKVKKVDLYHHLYQRDEGRCGICRESVKEEFLEYLDWRATIAKGQRTLKKRTKINIDIDHKYPKSKIKGVGWWSDITNLQLAHRTCNQAKADSL